MTTIINDPEMARRLIRQRRARGQDRYDEVWNGRYIINEPPNINHSEFVGTITVALRLTLKNLARVLPGTNITDQQDHWKTNYRCPDVAVFLPGNPAEDRDTHWYGGPDFAVEVLSPRDGARKKLDFYAQIGTRELLLIDRQPWQLELYQLREGKLIQTASAAIDTGEVTCETVRLKVSLRSGEARPLLCLGSLQSGEEWTV
ncbi:hypothetical protein Spb1_32060 [Planctopirus ephydatiae]|uniref:Putative restriction endonuclease domain-containing protein n=1 Tax=Planctopirus ephydatiae TaxID=2528019 RepID=A0A518GRQ4_9PLAN|nr:Uma2 family endonuclease [Planctopirus ephydatiae]QDV31262.1 hypothetical protein Spb1_32060 [Planctopirus ephydatiae]